MKHLFKYLLLMLITFTVIAQDGKKMTFQGSLFQTDQPFNGTTSLEFSIMLDSVTTWSETLTEVTVVNGLYSVVLGEENPLPANLFEGVSERMINVKVDGTDLGAVAIYAPFSSGDKPMLPLDLPGANGNRSVMLSSEGETGDDGTFRLSNADGFSRVTMYANGFVNEYDSLGTANRVWTGAGGAWFGGANGTMGVRVGSDGMESSNGFIELGDKEGAALVKAGINEDQSGNATGTLSLRGTDGSQFNITSHGIDYGDLFQLGNPDSGTYSQTRPFVYRIKNDNDPYSAVYLNRFDDGHARLQVAGHNNGESTGVGYLGAGHQGGYMYIGGTDPRNNLRGGMYVAENLPHLFMQGTFDVQGDINTDSLGNVSDTSYYRPELVNMDIHHEDGMEYGALTLRGTDGTALHISPYGIDGMNMDYRSKEFVLEHQWSDQQVGNLVSNQDGGQLNIGGIINQGDTATSYGGGISTGGKFWEGSPQLGYFHLRGTVVPENYFGGNMKFSMEAVNHGESEEAEFKMYGSELDENTSTKVVLQMNSIRNEAGQSAAEITANGPNSPNFALGAKMWEEDGANRPYMRLNGSVPMSFMNDNGTPTDSADDFEDFYHPDLLWMDITKWDDGTERGHLHLNGNGNTHTMEDWIDEVRNHGNTYTQQMSHVFRIKNDNDPFSAVYLNRYDDGQARLQVAGHNNGEFTGIGYLGAGHEGGYMYIGGQDPSNTLRGGMYVQDNLPHLFMQGTYDLQGDINTDSLGNVTDTSYYRPELVNMDVLHHEDGTESGSLTLRGTDGSEMHITSYGIEGLNLDYDAKEFVLQHEWSDQQVGNIIGLQDGGQINIGGLISTSDTTTSYGGGFSAGTKFWEGTPQLGYIHLRGTVNDANYFGANMKFSMEAVNHGDTEEAEFKMFGSELDGNNSTKPVLMMESVRDIDGNSSSHISGEGSNSPNFALGAKSWENNGANRPYFRMNGSMMVQGDSVDTMATYYHPDLIWMDVADWGDKEVGGISFRSTDGAEFGFNAYGFTGTVEHLNVNDLVSYGNGWRMSSFGLNGDENAEFNVVEISNGQNLGSGAGELRLNNNSGTTGVFMDGWGTINAGNVTVAVLTETSDKRFKQEIQPLEGALSKISNLNGYTYFWNRTANDVKGIKDDSQQIGLIAQEVEEVFPQLVKTDAEGYKSVNYAQMTAVLIEAVKELNAKVENLETENSSLKAQVEASANLENRLEQIEKLLGVKINETSSANNK